MAEIEIVDHSFTNHSNSIPPESGLEISYQPTGEDFGDLIFTFFPVDEVRTLSTTVKLYSIKREELGDSLISIATDLIVAGIKLKSTSKATNLR